MHDFKIALLVFFSVLSRPLSWVVGFSFSCDCAFSSVMRWFA